MTLPLQGLRLVDPSRRLPVSHCSMLLADFGGHTDEVLAEIGEFHKSGAV
ncbi:MAG TPA: hypothetical protein VLF14_05595 [Candidatus Binatia bacterium]|nr:hypothetical protein [Candidatus Binatia bacterium]